MQFARTVFLTALLSSSACADPNLAARVALLAQFDRVESRGIYYGGLPSKAFAAAAALTEQLSKRDAVRLLRHPNPVVRVYVALYLIENEPSAFDDVARLLGDGTMVETQIGCVGGGAPVNFLVAQWLCTSPDEGARVALLRELTHLRNDETVDRLLQCHTAALPVEVAAWARSSLGRGKHVVGAIGLLGAAADQESLPTLLKLTGSPDANVRQAVAEALANLPSPATSVALAQLLSDPLPSVSQAAAASYAQQKDADLRRVAPFLEIKPLAQRMLVGLAKAGTPPALALVEPLVGARPSPELADALLATEGGRALVRRNFDLVGLQALADLRDHRRSAAELLNTKHVLVRTAILQELARHPDRTLVPVIEERLDDENAYIRQLAARTLVRLGDPRVPELIARRVKSFPADQAMFTVATKLQLFGD